MVTNCPCLKWLQLVFKNERQSIQMAMAKNVWFEIGNSAITITSLIIVTKKIMYIKIRLSVYNVVFWQNYFIC